MLTCFTAFLRCGVTRILRFFLADLPLKILAVVIAVLLWFNAVLERSYLTDIRVPIMLDRIETEKLVSEFETREAVVTMEGKGKDLLGMRFRRPEFRLVVPEARAGVLRLKLAPTDLRLPEQLVVRSVNPDYIEVRLSEVGSRPVTVEVRVRGEPVKGLAVTDLRPLSTVRLLGPEEDIDQFTAVRTESLDLGSIRSSDTITLRVLPPEGTVFTVRPETVAVALTVEKEGARIFLGVPVSVVTSGSLQASVEPREAQIAVAGPESRLGDLKASDIQARIKVSALDPGVHRLGAEVALPPEFRLVKCEPALFEVTVQ